MSSSFVGHIMHVQIKIIYLQSVHLYFVVKLIYHFYCLFFFFKTCVEIKSYGHCVLFFNVWLFYLLCILLARFPYGSYTLCTIRYVSSTIRYVYHRIQHVSYVIRYSSPTMQCATYSLHCTIRFSHDTIRFKYDTKTACFSNAF